MAEVFRYEVIPSSSWAYLSTILMVSLFLKFGRFFSLRNLDILLLALLAPGLLVVLHMSELRNQIDAQISVVSDLERRDAERDVSSAQSKAVTASDLSDETDNPARQNSGQKSRNSSLGEGGFQEMRTADLNESADPSSNSLNGPSGENGTKSDVDDNDKKPALSELQLRISNLVKESENLRDQQFDGHKWLVLVGICLMIRMLIDPYMIRRPLLEPNLEFSGLTFLTVVLLLVLIANLVSAKVTNEDIVVAAEGKELATATASGPSAAHGPGYRLLFLFPNIPTSVANQEPGLRNSYRSPATPASLISVSKIMAIIGQLAVVIGIYMIGYLHFGNTRMGIGIVTLYLLLPYTAEMSGRVVHILPAAALVWAIVCYRKPFWAGIFIGLAMGLAYYPMFLLPLWFSFYWHRGLRDFIFGFFVMIAVLAITLIFTSSDFTHYLQNLQAMFGIWTPIMSGLSGIWEEGNIDPSFRVPVIAAFFCMSISFAVWPAQKNLGTLLGCSAALMIAVQFWHGFNGGLLIAWYLPLTLLTMFRPNLEDRTSLSLLPNK